MIPGVDVAVGVELVPLELPMPDGQEPPSLRDAKAEGRVHLRMKFGRDLRTSLPEIIEQGDVPTPHGRRKHRVGTPYTIPPAKPCLPEIGYGLHPLDVVQR